ncbi:uncharacterized protein LOC105646163 isoform X2 [Jatropha curcas]|uniref:uncharacterized protein LOC105646163 isoform X2 n=1 Tax=Jatropha curcas TaxID=180498 RepID=UPI0005FA9E9D|nr:uncharacterized protein LOC105646163 isoform X2 [Jatropha curcas]
MVISFLDPIPSRSSHLNTFSHLLSSPQLFSSQFSFVSLQISRYKKIRLTPRALREWREYEDAVKRKDLATALRFLKSVEINKNKDNTAEKVNGSVLTGPIESGISDLGLFDGSQRDWEVLDTCLNADDMRLVGSAYGFLKNRGFLPNFGKFSNIVLEGPRDVTPTVFKSSTGLEAILGLAFMDSIFLGGTCLAQISSYWPPYKRRILVHEAGHLLVAYLMGCPIRGVILDPIVAMQMGIQGQAGTQFWDEKMNKELAEGQLSGGTFDRYCMVLFAGIAAEALVYGEAEGGENDENLFRSISVLLQPPLSVAQMSNQARWSVLQAYNLLKWQKHAHRAAVKALESGSSLSVVIRRIEEAMSSGT